MYTEEDYLFSKIDSIYYQQGDFDGDLIVVVQLGFLQLFLEESMYGSSEFFDDIKSLYGVIEEQ